MAADNLFACILEELGVRHTSDFTRRAYACMPFRSLFGLSKLLQSYGIDSETYRLANPATDIDCLPVPFLARVGDTFVMVSSVSAGSVTVDYGEGDGPVTMSRPAFDKAFGGIVTLFYPRADAGEPGYRKHRLFEIAAVAKRWILVAASAFVVVWCFVSTGLWRSWAAWLLLAADAAGLYVTYLLFLKSHGFRSKHGDRICGVIDRSGCHTVLETSAAKFLGAIGWSEVGLGYFAVSTLTMLLFPATLPWLALINACVCPFSFWSVWYQKYRAKAWCTLCLITQALLWISLAIYIIGGFFGGLRLGWGLLPLMGAYVATVFGINAVGDTIDSIRKDNSKDNPQ